MTATDLHKIGAIKFGDFTLASGRKSPYYVDLRLVYSNPEVFEKFASMCADLVQKKVDGKVDRIAGVPISGIPLATLVSHKLSLPLVLVRKEAKTHGREKKIEGELEKGDKVVLVEDLVTVGGSVLEAVDAIKKEGGEVSDVVVILDREEGALDSLSKAGIKLHSCMRISEVVEKLREDGLLDSEQADSILENI